MSIIPPADSKSVTSPASIRPARAELTLGLLAIAMMLGFVALSIAVVFYVVPTTLLINPILPTWGWGLGIGGIVTMCVCGWRTYRVSARYPDLEEVRDEPRRSNLLFGSHLTGIGYALLLTALFNVVVVTSVIYVKWMNPTFSQFALFQSITGLTGNPLAGDIFNAGDAEKAMRVTAPALIEADSSFNRIFGRNAPESLFIAILLVMSTLTAQLGAMFFFCSSLWGKIDVEKRDVFDHSIFWAGLWFRMGEAVLFGLVFFLLLRVYAPDQYILLPVVSLLVGMFLRTGEQLINGIATRVFAAVGALIPIERGAPSRPKTLPILLSGLPTEPEPLADARDALLRAVSLVPGVYAAAVDMTAKMLRVVYDPDVVKIDDIRAVVDVLGYTPQSSKLTSGT